MDSQPQDSCGEIRYTIGNITKRQGIHGGWNELHIVFGYTMQYELIISVDLMSTMQFLMEVKQQRMAAGSQDREWICLIRSMKSLAN